MTRSLIAHSTLSRVLRTSVLGTLVFTVLPSTIGCLDRPVAPATPRTSNTLTDQIRLTAVDKIDLLFMIDNSSSMADKQQVLAKAVPDLVGRLITPDCVKGDGNGGLIKVARVNGQCPAGSGPEFTPITDIHIGVVTSSLGGHGSPDRCLDLLPTSPGQTSGSNFTGNDHAHLINRGDPAKAMNWKYPEVPTYDNRGFLAWDAEGKADPPGESNIEKLNANFTEIVQGADQVGCGFEASLEAWYRFLVEPNPPLTVQKPASLGQTAIVSEEADVVLLRQRADFLRPDSLLAIVALSDENDCSVIDGQLPGDVCEDPSLNDDGIAVGCNTQRTGWPRGYIEGNAINLQEVAGNKVTGATFGPNYLTTTTSSGSVLTRLAVPTAACEDDPTSPECKSCYVVDKDNPECYDTPGNSATRKLLPSIEDEANVRCWDQKRRFGVDMLYPLQRYTDGLTQAKVYDRNGYHVANPLFADLPYEQALRDEKPLARSRIQSRDPNLIFFAAIIGVPWQDIARDINDLKQGFLPALPSADDPTAAAIDWDLILGDPFYLDNKEERRGRLPTDPFMIETTKPRSGTNPLTGDQIVAAGAGGWNKINGHEYDTESGDLQYSCIFNLPIPQQDSLTCTQPGLKNPLCEDGEGTGNFVKTQYRAKAYPGTRFLQVLKDVSSHAIVASICAENLTDATAADYGYRPAVATIIDRLKTQLTGRCLPRQLDPNSDGSTPCLIIDAKFPIDPAAPNNPDEVAACKKCENDSNSRSPIPADVLEFLGADVKGKYECLCQVNQLKDVNGTQDLTECRTDPNIQSPTSGNGGWCYVDPAAVDKSAPNAEELIEQAKAIVKNCPANEKRNIRFLNADTENTTLFITCLGAATSSGSSETSSLNVGASTTSLASTK